VKEFAALDNALQSADNAARISLKDPTSPAESRYTAAWAEIPMCDRNKPLLRICDRYRIGMQGIGMRETGSVQARVFKPRADSRLSRELWRQASTERRMAAEVDWATEFVACLRRWEFVASAHCRVGDNG